MKYDVITIGSAVQDVFLLSRDFKIIASTEFSTGYGECFSFGSKVELKDIFFDTGGAATNAAVTFANLGLSAAALTRVGADEQGRGIIADLRRRTVATALVTVDKKEKTAYSAILLTAEGDRTILTYRGASKQFKPAELASSAQASWIYLSSVAGSIPMLDRVFAHAAKIRAQVAWNPGSAELALDRAIFKKYASQAKVLIMNKEEAEKVTGTAGTVAQLARIVKAWNPFGYTLITDGRNGAVVALDSQLWQVDALGSLAVNVTGAGDAFGSGFVAGLLLKNDPDYALRLAALNADGVIQEMGAKHGLLEKTPGKKQLERVHISFIT